MSQQTTTNGLKTHIESKHEEVRYPCEKCDYTGTAVGHLKKHIKGKHDM